MGVLSNKGTPMNRLILGNCLDTLVRLPDKSIDLLCTDPPYGIGIAKPARSETQSSHRKSGTAAAPPKVYFDEMLRVSKHQVIWGGNYFATHASSFTMLARVVEERWFAAPDIR